MGGLLIGAAASKAASVLGGLGATNWLLGPMGRDADYAGNRSLVWFQSSPPPPSLIDAFYAGRFGDPRTASAKQKLWELLNEYGIHRTGSFEPHLKRGKAWLEVVDLARPFLNFDVLKAAYYYDGQIPGDRRRLVDVLKRQGIFDESQQAIAIEQGQPPSTGEILGWYFRGLIDRDTALRWLQWGGTLDEKEQVVALLARPPIGLDAAIQLYNRKVLTRDAFLEQIGRMGFGTDPDNSNLAELAKQLPTPSDLITFSVREVWDEDVVRAFGYDEEFPVPFQFWMERQGYNWSQDVYDQAGNLIQGVPWPKAWWRAHWQVISPSQAYEMLHRLRPERIGIYQDVAPGVQPFTIEDVRRVLKIADYPAAFRDRLTALSYKVLTRVDVRRLFQLGIIDLAEVTAQYQDEGYTRRDAERLAAFTQQQVGLSQFKAIWGGSKPRVMKAYETGTIDRDQAGRFLYMLSLQSLQAVEAFQAMPPGRQATVAFANPSITAQLDIADLDEQTNLVRQALANIRRAYLTFEITLPQAQQAMLQLGLVPAKVQTYLRLWQWQFFGRGKMLSASQAAKALAEGLITPAEAMTRFLALGYSRGDAAVLAAQANIDLQLARARAASAVAKNAAQQRSALLREQAALKQMLKQAQQNLARQGSAADLKRWVKKGIITEREFRVRMAQLGYSPETIANEYRYATGK